jgi:hypothetical protein
MRRLTLRASPMQKLSGVVLRSDPPLRVAIAVLPKLWRPKVPSDQACAWLSNWSGDTLAATIYEGDTLSVSVSGEHAQRKLAMLEDLCRDCANKDAREKVLFEPAPIDDLVHNAPSTDFDAAALDLVLLSELAAIDPSTAITGEFSANPIAADWLLPFLHRRFVQLVSVAMRHARRGYAERREMLDTVRGRPRGNSLALSLESGVPAVECDFEEFEFATPLLRAIVAGLEEIARSTVSLKIARSPTLHRILEENKSRSIGLRNRLGAVPALPAPDAIRVARAMRLNRLERAWNPALRLIDPILERKALAASAAPEPSQVIDALSENSVGRFLRIEVETWDVWQKLLTNAASSIGEIRDFGADPPWKELGQGPRPDIDLQWNERRLILDAKYKHFDGRADVADAYQMFAYSHLMRGAPKAKDLFLLYPDRGMALATEGYRRMPQLHSTDEVRLSLVPLPWPTRDDLRTPDDFLTGLALLMRKRLAPLSR